MAAAAAELDGLFRAPESADPSDLDSLGDATGAGSRLARKRKAGQEEALAPESGRLRLRPKVPVLPKYKGKKVDRRDVFGEDAGGADDFAAAGGASGDEDDGAASDASGAGAAAMAGGVGGGLGISGSLEEEYERMMQQTRKDLEVMRAPSQQETQRREEDAQQLRRQLDTWGALVELRIHLEGALALGHRLPSGAAAAALCAGDGPAASEAAAASAEVRGLLGGLLALQQGLARRRGAPLDGALDALGEAPCGEPELWNALDGRLQSVLDFELEVADGWKERTQLDVRRSFKVLDQSLATQMQAMAEVEPVKLRKRCTPPPGRHAVFGAALTPASASSAENIAAAGETPSKASAKKPRDDGEKEEEEQEGEEQDIFDDREFYVQLLREVLASGGKPGDGINREDKELQAELQGRRAAKKQQRAQVERRASKGRKIRYVPIEKLQNFMAPRPRVSADGLEAASGLGAADAMLRALFSGGIGT